MLRDIIKKEIMDNITSPKFVFTFLLCTVLILLSVYMGAADYAAEKKEHAAGVAMNRQEIENNTEYIEVLENGIIYRPPEVLGTIVNGIEMAVGRAVRFPKLLTDPKFIESKYASNPDISAFGALDLMFIVKIVLSLFAILFTYNAIVGEKREGNAEAGAVEPGSPRPSDSGQGRRRLFQPAAAPGHSDGGGLDDPAARS